MGNAAAKQHLRKMKLAERAALSAAERERLSLSATRQLLELELLANCHTVLVFYPFRDEIDTRPFIEAAIKRGQQIWLPLTEPAEKRLTPYIYAGENSLRQGAYGIYEPDPLLSQQGALDQLDAVILPGVAFDCRGGRLGYGGGYYDRFLSGLQRKPLLVGFAFSCQIAEKVPMEPHDYQLDFLVADNGAWGPFTAGR